MTAHLFNHANVIRNNDRLHFRGLALIASVMAVLLAGSTWGSSPARAAGQSVVDLPVSFTVHNTNTSADPCLSDGATYTV